MEDKCKYIIKSLNGPTTYSSIDEVNKYIVARFENEYHTQGGRLYNSSNQTISAKDALKKLGEELIGRDDFLIQNEINPDDVSMVNIGNVSIGQIDVTMKTGLKRKLTI